MMQNTPPGTSHRNDPLDVGPGFLTGAEIEEHWHALFPATEHDTRPPTPSDINPASVDLHLGSEYYVKSLDAPGHLSDEDAYLTIPSGEFALLTTWEVIHIPTNILGLITMRVRHKRAGLINISGFHVDPGFEGQIFYSVYNAGPTNIKLKLKAAVFTIFFATLTRPTDTYDGGYQEQKGLPADLVQAIGAPPLSLVNLERRLDLVESNLRLAAAFIIGLVVPVAGIIGFVLNEVL